MLRVVPFGSGWAVTRHGVTLYSGGDFALAVLMVIRHAAPIERKV